jgi:hypothetical protein
MKRVFLGAAVVCILLATGCGGDDVTLNPGDPADPAYQLFSEQFQGIDETSGLMTEATFEILGDFFPQKPGVFETAASFEYTVEYNEIEKHWTANATIDNPEDETTFTLTETIQFIVDGTAVQYPTLETLDEARCSLDLSITAPNIETATASRTLVIVPVVVGETVNATVNGSGSLEAVFTNTETLPEGDRTCDVTASFTSLIRDLQISSSSECPSAGSITHSGNLSVACMGAGAGTVDGHWTVTTRFNGTAVSVTVVSGGNRWESSGTCGAPA